MRVFPLATSISTSRFWPTSLPLIAAIVLESGEKAKLYQTGLSRRRDAPPVTGMTRSAGRVRPR